MAELVVGGVTRVWIGEGLGSARVIGDAPGARAVFVTQPGIPAEIGWRLADEFSTRNASRVIEVPDGEAAKTLAVADEVCRRLEEAGLDRGDLIVGIGGGALTDLAGFVGGVYLRGVRVHLVPTTLVAAIDASIGGKSALNLAAKNQVGLLRHPALVAIDLSVLAALPETLMRQGSAEALKAGLIGDPELVDLYEQHGLDAPLGEVVERAIRVKAKIVDRDFEERGERAHLNYGHTIGHALERAAAMSHGDAIAVGMVAAGRVSALVAGFDGAERQQGIIAALGLPVTAPKVDPNQVRELLMRDKKRSDGELRMVVLEDTGRPRVVAVDDATVTAALAAVGIGG